VREPFRWDGGTIEEIRAKTLVSRVKGSGPSIGTSSSSTCRTASGSKREKRTFGTGSMDDPYMPVGEKPTGRAPTAEPLPPV